MVGRVREWRMARRVRGWRIAGRIRGWRMTGKVRGGVGREGQGVRDGRTGQGAVVDRSQLYILYFNNQLFHMQDMDNSAHWTSSVTFVCTCRSSLIDFMNSHVHRYIG